MPLTVRHGVRLDRAYDRICPFHCIACLRFEFGSLVFLIYIISALTHSGGLKELESDTYLENQECTISSNDWLEV